MREDIHFIMKNGDNTSGRIAGDVIKAVVETLVKNGVEIDGVVHRVAPFSECGFDVKDVRGFNLIEFKITKTGWER